MTLGVFAVPNRFGCVSLPAKKKCKVSTDVHRGTTWVPRTGAFQSLSRKDVKDVAVQDHLELSWGPPGTMTVLHNSNLGVTGAAPFSLWPNFSAVAVSAPHGPPRRAFGTYFLLVASARLGSALIRISWASLRS